VTTNQYGLSRDIPDPIRRQVRQACGFGCVCCGASIIEYHHVEPPFSEAKIHDAKGIVLLCPRCHAKAERHFLSEETIIQTMRNPVCNKTGYASDLLDVGDENPKIVFAGVTFCQTLIPIIARGIPLFMIQKAEEARAPFRLSANFANSIGHPSLQIVDNEWRVSTANSDVEAVGGRIVIRDDPGHISLNLVASSRGQLVIEQLDMFLAGLRFIGNPDELKVLSPGGGEMTLSNCLVDGGRYGIVL
jgi:hypothetical protein